MRRVRSKDTGPELTVRKLTHSLGFRYNLHRDELPGKPEIANQNALLYSYQILGTFVSLGRVL